MVPAALECVLTYCAHPHDYFAGSHAPPDAANDIELVTPTDWTVESWHIVFGAKIKYRCTGTTHIELPEPSELDPSQTELEVECLDTGVYNTPIVNNKLWPNCTQTVRCGPPPEKPTNNMINGTNGYDGSIIWLDSASNNQDTYNTRVEYRCANGSKFDTSGNDDGDTITLEKRCRWDKTWTPDITLPSCLVTHCVAPFPIPEDTFLKEVSNEWTLVNQKKQYECLGKQGETHTRFWESDRSKSTFEMLCLADGSYSFDNLRESWPTCIEDITCEDQPPAAPTHKEYTLPAYDGSVHMRSLLYPVVPVLSRTDVHYNSSYDPSLLARNYMANLTYNCGSARRFITDAGPEEGQSMTCGWDKQWSPTHELKTCDWVACLKPPTPPLSTHLRCSSLIHNFSCC